MDIPYERPVYPVITRFGPVRFEGEVVPKPVACGHLQMGHPASLSRCMAELRGGRHPVAARILRAMSKNEV